ncbi:MAG: hypothetical protein M3439_04660, partial [Chloroflexota bacterium]|nr:hypothetical protein [Chloroflexota bacterium]
MSVVTRHSLAFLTVAVAVGSIVSATPVSAADTPSSFYVGCSNASDENPGTSASSPWRTLDKANQASLNPGDRLLLQRGCTWDGTRLRASWTGTAAQNIAIRAFGDSALARPVIQNGGWTNVLITGSYLNISQLDVRHDVVQVTSCGQPIGDYYGFVMTDGAHHNVLHHSRATSEMTGVMLAPTSSYNRVSHNELVGNNVLQSFGTNSDLGAQGMTLNGHNQIVSYNTFRGNQAVCPNSKGRMYSSSIELFAASNNAIHHNSSTDRVFTELGSSATVKSRNNTFSYNLFTPAPSLVEARFIVTRGAGDAAYGPVFSTRVLHNTTYEMGVDGQGTVCILGCGPDVLTVRDNVFFTTGTVMYADAPFEESRNLLWNASGEPRVQIQGWA